MTWPKVTQLIKTEKLDLNSALTSCRGLRREPLGAAGLKSSSGTGNANALPPPPTPPQAHRVRDWGWGGRPNYLHTLRGTLMRAQAGEPLRGEREQDTPSASLLPRPPVTQTKLESFSKPPAKGYQAKPLCKT